ncbi:OmpA family protein [Methylobacterium aquaticum]|uniref:Flagellar motor protein n=1 Tax=Methylobacterium aquaticum TaxID=270351 RepID=A0A0C6FPS5_9HYPH|nr:OmpA family protein [Methylobacterium aquaticum]BAQ44675.1 flagellar motor protein [Methylobacterium aquaticum]
MRGAIRRHAHDEEEESAFVSMTDLTVSFLFIVIILLAFFASQLKDDQTVPVAEYQRVFDERNALRTSKEALERERDRLAAENAELRREVARLEEELRKERTNRLQTYLAAVSNERDRILRTLRDRLLADFPDLKEIVSIEADALRFKGDGLFASGASRLAEDKRRVVAAIAARLNELLPCYTFGKAARWQAECNAAGAVIEAVQIEGHTDASGQDRSNFSLSTERAIETLFAMSGREPALLDDLNSAGQPVLSVSGYGRLRPVADNASERGKATNRRIDLRIIMYTPQNVEEVERIKDNLRRGLTGTALQ